MNVSTLDFELETDGPKIIKVVGVGGGGGNAVTHMYLKGIHDVSFLLCNTDKQALERSVVPNQLVLGKGLGSGNIPQRAKDAAEGCAEDIRKLLSDGTNMVFVTAGMGGGTGTGAAPVIARIAKEMDILTVGIVTIPFKFEGKHKIIQALEGVEEIRRNVDALLVINNERLRKIYPDLTMSNAFGKADDTLTVAAKSIAEIITLPGIINLDFADVHTTMKDGGVALISNGYGEGERRVQTAINEALKSPLLNNNDIFTAQKILFNISYSEESELLMEEMDDVHNFMAKFNSEIEVIWGTSIDNNLGKQVKMTILSTGFGIEAIPEIADKYRKDLEAKIGEYYDFEEKESNYSTRWAILSTEELDDDDFISLLEDHPTHNRDRKIISDFRAKAKKNRLPETKNQTTSSPGNDAQAIVFA